MKDQLTIRPVPNGWEVVDVCTDKDRPRVGAVLTKNDLHVMNQCQTWEITKIKAA